MHERVHTSANLKIHNLDKNKTQTHTIKHINTPNTEHAKTHKHIKPRKEKVSYKYVYFHVPCYHDQY